MPKPLAPVAGRPFLEHLMDYWIAQGARRFVLSVGYRHEQIEKHFGASYRSIPVAYAIEREPLGTGGGLLLALQSVAGEAPVFAVNGDTFFAVDAAAMGRFHAQTRAAVTMALFRSSDWRRYTPVRVDGEGRVLAMKGEPGPGAQPVNGGVYLIEREAFASAGFRSGGRFSLEDELFPALLAKNARLFGFEASASFIDIGVPEDYAQAASVVAGAR